MNITKLRLPGLMAGAAFGLSMLLGAAPAHAAAAKVYFMHDGIVYLISGNKISTPALHPKRNPPVPENVENYDPNYMYTGDIVLPATVEYKGVTYTLNDLSTGFKGMPITSLVMPETVTTLGNGAFQDCDQLTSVTMSPAVTKYTTSLFAGCVKLKEFTVPGTITQLGSSMFKDCTGLEKLTFEASDTPLSLTALHIIDGPDKNLKELYAYRQLDDDGTMANKPFRGNTNLTKVVVGEKFTKLSASYFEGCSALADVTFEGQPTEFNSATFAGTAVKSIEIPASITNIPASCFAGCAQLAKVTCKGEVAAIEAMAFQNTGLATFDGFPASIATIADMAFQNAKLSGDLTLPASLARLGAQAFAGNEGITSIAMPAPLRSIGNGAFMRIPALATLTVDAANENYVDVDHKYVTDKEGKTLVAFAPMCDIETLDIPSVEAIAPYACYGAAKLKALKADACTNYGDYSFLGSGLESLTVKGLVGRYVAQDCHSLAELTVEGAEVPVGIAAGCEKLANVNLQSNLTVVKQDAFKGTAALKSLDLGSILAIIEAGAFDNCGLETLTVGSTYPAVMPEGVFTDAHSAIVAKVPVELVDTYKAAAGWNKLTVTGDANVVAGGADMGMPAGLYYAGEDGMLHCVYADGESDTYDVGGIPHTFQLLQFKNRIYGACAGNKFVYSATGATDGDGKLFYISKVGGETFQAVVLDNAGGNAYKDPFGLYIYDETLYVNDRNVCVRKIPADAISLPSDYASWMENNWMAYYGQGWSYGCIKSGFAITTAAGGTEPLYWLGMKYNGNGIFRFRAGDIGNAEKAGPMPAEAAFFANHDAIITTFNIDEAHGHLYLYVDFMGKPGAYVKGGIYRVNIADVEANPTGDFASFNPVLIDGAPVMWEGSGANEHVGIPQFAFDEKKEYLYWCHREPTADQISTIEAAEAPGVKNSAGVPYQYQWAETFDDSKATHHDAIKRIKLGEAQPTVEIVKAGVRGYGLVPVNYEGSTKPAGAHTVIAQQPELISAVAGVITAAEAATVEIFDVKGTMIASVALAAGESYDATALNAGVYVAVATAEGAQQVLKFAK